jgi:hypothetical protein
MLLADDKESRTALKTPQPLFHGFWVPLAA